MLLSPGARRRSLRLWPAAGVAAAPGDSGGRSHARDKGSLSRHNRGRLCLWGKPQRPRRIPKEDVGFWGGPGEYCQGLCSAPGVVINQKIHKEQDPENISFRWTGMPGRNASTGSFGFRAPAQSSALANRSED